MCKSKIGIDCDECELNKNKKYSSCELFMMKEPEKAVEIIEEWSSEHPIKTRQSVFLERYPDTTKDENGVIDIAPCAIEKSRFKKIVSAFVIHQKNLANNVEMSIGMKR